MNQTEKDEFTVSADAVAAMQAKIAELEREAQSLRYADQALRDSEARYRMLFDSNPHPMWVFDRETLEFLAVNNSAVRHYGYSRAEFLALKITDIRPPEDVVALRDILNKKLEGLSQIGRWRHVKKDRSIIDVEIIGHEIEFAGRPARLVLATDITQRLRAEVALRGSESKYRTLVETTATGYLIVDTEGRVLDANAEYVRLTGHQSLDEIRGRSVVEWTAPHDLERNAKEIRKTIERGFVRNLEIDYVDRNGRIMPIEVNATVMRSDHEKVILALCRDISQRKRTEAAMRESAELQRMTLSELDHRVRNNLASLAALIDISKRDKTCVAEFAASISGRVHAMSSVHSLLSRARWYAVGLRSLVQSLTPGDLHDSVSFDGPDVLITPRQVTALGMMIQELMANSLKYGALQQAGGHVELSWTVDVSHTVDERRLDFRWREIGGPQITTTPQPGQGSELILGFARSEMRGEVELAYPQDGACHRFRLRLDPVKA